MHRFHRVKHDLIHLNLFNDDTNDQHEKRNQILSTRLYLVIFFIILFLFVLYTSLSSETLIITKSEPTFEQYEDLYEDYSNRLQCPCENISISYKSFLSTQPNYHSICSSQLLNDNWIEFLSYENISYYYQLDYRRMVSLEFQMLRGLCQHIREMIEKNRIQFYSTQMFTLELLSNQTFTLQIQSFIETFQRSLTVSFQNLMYLFRNLALNDELYSAIDASNVIYINSDGITLKLDRDAIYYATFNWTDESTSIDCYNTTYTTNQLFGGIYANLDRYELAGSVWYEKQPRPNTYFIAASLTLPGIVVSCSPTESLMKSTLECFFDETCLNAIIFYMNHSKISLNSRTILNESSRYSPQTTVEILINELFIEQWITNISYVEYFQQCHPSFCQYSIEKRHNSAYILTTLLSLYGGLTITLRILIPIVIKLVRRKKVQAIVQSVPWKIRLYQLIQKTIDTIKNLNSFDSYSTNEHKQRNERISTKIYLILLVISLIIFSIYTTIRKHTKIYTINHPTQIEYEELYEKYSLYNLQCPCKQISIEYKEFLSFQPTYHSICSSIFASNTWKQYGNFYQLETYASNDFIEHAQNFFPSLSYLCQLSIQTTETSLTEFDKNYYITSQIISSDIFTQQIQSYIQRFQTTTKQTFQQIVNIYRSIVSTNAFISYRLTNVNMNIQEQNQSYFVQTHLINSSQCSCATDANCKTELYIYASPTARERINGLYVACYILESILSSTTECFFDPYCIQIIRYYLSGISEIVPYLHPLNQSASTIYPTNTTFEYLFENLFIENWNENYSYEKYYQQCQPNYCSYTINNQHADIFEVVSKIIGIFGGLSIILKIFIPIIVNRIRREKQQRPVENISKYQQFHRFYLFTKTKFINLNLFRTKSTNHQVVYRQKLTTKLYLCLILFCLVILIFYMSFNQITISTTIQLDNQKHYEDLQRQYPSTVHCSCSQISIEYQHFLEINFFYHEICSSNFTSQIWIDYLYDFQQENDRNYHAFASAQFRTLQTLCQLTQTAINTSLIQFYARQFFANELISFDIFEQQIDSFIQSFQTSLSHTFTYQFNTIRSLVQGNAYISAYESNWQFTVLETYTDAPIYTNPRSYADSCSCATSSKCFQPAIRTDQYPFGLPGLFIGCSPLETILQSTFECFYNQTCLNDYLLSINRTILFNGNRSLISTTDIYPINETVEQILDRLFINQWFINKSYENYYEHCQATHCTYSYIQTFDIFYLITSLLSIYGGLSTALKILTPILIFLFFSIFCQQKINIQPIA